MSYYVSNLIQENIREVEVIPAVKSNIAVCLVKVDLENFYNDPGEIYIDQNNVRVAFNGFEKKIKDCLKGDLHQIDWLMPKNYGVTSSGTIFFFGREILKHFRCEEDVVSRLAFIVREVFKDKMPTTFFDCKTDNEGLKVQIVFQQVA